LKEEISVKKRLSFLFLLLVISLILTACSASPYSTSPGTTNKSQSTGNAVSIENFSFNPAVLTVPAGTIVVWTNNDSVQHDIKAADFSSKPLAKGETFQYKFDKPGVYDYTCGIHPSMKGQIIVQ
jgi:plastocyanin